MKYEYTKSFNTSYTTIDRSGKLGLVELMNLNQDMITEFFGSIGSDNKILRQQNNAAWIYTRTKVSLKELPFWNTKTVAKTFVSNKSPIRLEVETDLFDEKENLLFAAKTEMCAIDFVERKIRKIDSIVFPQDLEVSESLIPEPFSRMKADFTESDFIYSQKVYASDTDFTNHTNNARYVKYLMNTFNSKFYEEKSITDFEIQFAKESTEDDELTIWKKETGDKEFIFQILKDQEAVVKAIMKYSDEARLWTEI